MSEATQDPNFTKQCSELWNEMVQNTSLDRFHESITIHEKVVFLGHADVTLGIGEHFRWKVSGIQVKLLNGKSHLDFPSEKGSDGKYYPMSFPKTAQIRAVLTAMIFQNDEIQKACQNAAELVFKPAESELAAGAEGQPAAAPAVPNPFE